jgi:hypothetical protein
MLWSAIISVRDVNLSKIVVRIDKDFQFFASIRQMHLSSFYISLGKTFFRNIHTILLLVHITNYSAVQKKTTTNIRSVHCVLW